MRKVVVSEFVSLDGVMEDPGGSEGWEHGGWSFQFERGDEGDKFKLDEVMAAEALLLGRVTYEAFAEAWPSRTDLLVNGSAQLVQALMEHDLVDEYRLMVFPIVLGSGKRLFPESRDTTTLRLVDTRPAGDTLILIYQPARDGGEGSGAD